MESKLTPNQLQQLKEKFCASVVDNMELDTLIEIVYDQLLGSYHHYDQQDMKEEIVSYFCDDDQEYNTLINEVNPYSVTNPEAVTDYGVGK